MSMPVWPRIQQAVDGLVRGRVNLKSDAIPYDFAGLPRRKVINAILAETSAYLKPQRAWGMPTHLMVEPSAHCNLSCTLCPVTKGLQRPQGHMPLDLFRRLMDEVGEYIFTLLFWDWGEPFANPQSCEMIAYAKTKGVKVISSTNGHLFSQSEQADRLIRSGLDTIIFAIDGATQGTYERYRQGGKLATAMEGIRMLAARKQALQSATPLINFRFIVMAHNEYEIPLVKAMAPRLGANALTFKTLNPRAMDPYSDREESDPGAGSQYLPRDEKYWRFKPDSQRGAPERLRRNPCKHLWVMPTVHWDGTICACAFDPREQYPLGSLERQSFREIWQGEAYRQLRRGFRSGWQKVPLCADCSYAYKGGNCSRDTIAEAIFYDQPS
jgi:radical SAM protein with 4Fe4S-binding SPASM domain